MTPLPGRTGSANLDQAPAAWGARALRWQVCFVSKGAQWLAESPDALSSR